MPSSMRAFWLVGFALICGTIMLITTDPAESCYYCTSTQQPLEATPSTVPSWNTAAKPFVTKNVDEQSDQINLIPTSDVNDQVASIDHQSQLNELDTIMYGDNILLEIESMDDADFEAIRLGTECQVGDLTVIKVDKIDRESLNGQLDFTLDTTTLFYEELMDSSEEITCETEVRYNYRLKEQQDVTISQEQKLLVQYVP